MNPESIALLLVKATMVLIAGFAAAHILRRASASTRHLVWLATLAALLIVPGLATWAPLSVAILPSGTAASSEPPSNGALVGANGTATRHATAALHGASALSPSIHSAPLLEAPAAWIGGVDTPAAPAASPWRGLRPDATEIVRVVVLLWGIVACVLALALLRSWITVRGIVRRARPLETPDWRAALREASHRLGIADTTAIVCSDEVRIPFACGVVSPVIVLPADCDEWTSGCRRSVLLHELAHIRRRDLLSHTLARVACALNWFHPLAWMAAERLRAESEGACDDLALTSGERPSAYAEHLLDVVAAARLSAVPSMALAMARRGDIEGRLIDILEPRRARGTPSVRQAGLLLAVLGLVAVGIGVIAPVAAARSLPPTVGGSASSLPSGSASQAQDATANAIHGARMPDVMEAGTESSGGERPAASNGQTMARETTPQIGSTSIAQPSFTGTWAIRMAAPDEDAALSREVGGASIVHVALRTPGLNTFYVPLQRLETLRAAEIMSSGGPVSFRLRRDAGTFTFDGSFVNGRGTGSYAFTPDPAYVEALAQRGIAPPTPGQQYSLGRHEVELTYIDELIAQGYARPSIDALVTAGMSGADLRYLRAMGALGYRLGTVDALVSLSNNGVDPEHIEELATLGYRGLPVEDLRSMRNDGLTAARIRDMNARAGRQLSVQELMERDAMRKVAANAARAVRSLTNASTPREGRWVIHRVQGGSVDLELFWSDSTNWRRSFPSSAFVGITPSELGASTRRAASFRIDEDAGDFEFEGALGGGAGAGSFTFHPERGFLAQVRELGIAGTDEATDHDLKNLAWSGVSLADVRDFHGLGFAPFAFEQAVELAIFQVTPDYARTMKSLGLTGTSSVSEVIDLWRAGVTPAYVKELESAGYGKLSARQLMDMRRAHVTPEFILALRRTGTSGLTPEELIRRARSRPR